ncbi:hypothetical protein F5050DRAFT_1883297 [Lentinula boryana]|uniref:Uncharacterized protein n=1 Tax=Lentinula boryana TaxID=40481 RepID=A0ABQ8PYQ3_9AGAR|nr:hypothetical protein F5050DRAFT_1883297 [Lentinula boryana]
MLSKPFGPFESRSFPRSFSLYIGHFGCYIKPSDHSLATSAISVPPWKHGPNTEYEPMYPFQEELCFAQSNDLSSIPPIQMRNPIYQLQIYMQQHSIHEDQVTLKDRQTWEAQFLEGGGGSTPLHSSQDTVEQGSSNLDVPLIGGNKSLIPVDLPPDCIIPGAVKLNTLPDVPTWVMGLYIVVEGVHVGKLTRQVVQLTKLDGKGDKHNQELVDEPFIVVHRDSSSGATKVNLSTNSNNNNETDNDRNHKQNEDKDKDCRDIGRSDDGEVI